MYFLTNIKIIVEVEQLQWKKSENGLRLENGTVIEEKVKFWSIDEFHNFPTII